MTAPGSVPPPSDRLEQYIKQLERRVAELERRDLSNGTVGQGGRIRGLYKDGTQAFAYGTDPADGKNRMLMHYTTGKTAFRITPGSPLYGANEQLVINDLAEHRVLATDDVAGYGLVEPSYQFMMAEIAGLNWVNGVEQEATQAKGFFYNPVLWSELLVTNYATMTGASCRLRITKGSTTVYSAPASITGSGTAQRMVLLPSAFINAQGVTASWMLTPVGSGTVRTVPLRCCGSSKSFYDLNPGLH